MCARDLDFSYTQNRELSWLTFNDRVLDEARDPETPLFERIKFVSIFTSNLDEYFMIRVGGLQDLSILKKEPIDNKSNQTPTEQITSLLEMLHPLIRKRAETFHQVEKDLEPFGIKRYDAKTLQGEDRTFVESYFNQYVLPILSPQIINPRHPFPNLRNVDLYAVYSLDGEGEEGTLGLIDVPETLPRVLELPNADGKPGLRYILLEDIVLAFADTAFGDYTIADKTIMRITRNADINPDEVFSEDEEDYRQHMKKVLKKRMRLAPVRIEFQSEFDPHLVRWIRKLLGLSSGRVFVTDTPIDVSYVFGLEDRIPEYSQREILYQPFSPQPSPDVNPTQPIYEQVMDNDIMLFYPYERMDPFLELIHEAAYDPTVISIKITLYRIAKKSRLAESLIAASENGKEVTVLMELRARFDEENNIDWAERLEDAGCIVSYGSEGFKVHSKICQITRRINGRIRRITQLGTGNYNEKTARLYSDLSLMTAHEGVGEDANAFFRNMSLSELAGEYEYLGVAPYGLKSLIMDGIDREIARAERGEKGRIIFKMNSLTDRDLIDKLSEASQKGVSIDLIIRGICCILPGVPGKTDNVRVRSIVGRMLEHARIYCFGEEASPIYLSSADLMTRNTERRVEIAYPLLEDHTRAQVRGLLDLQLKDNVKARQMDSEGVLQRIPIADGAEAIDSQQRSMDYATERARCAGLHPDVSYRATIEATPQQRVAPVMESMSHATEVDPGTQVPVEPEATPTHEAERGRISHAFELFGAALRVLFGGKR